MESPNLTPAPLPNDPLDELLRRGAEAPLPDYGFSARVLAALPPRSRPQTGRIRTFLCLVAASAGLAVALARPAAWADLPAVANQLDTAIEALLVPLTDPWLLLIVLAGILFLPWITANGEPEDGLL